MSPITTVQVNVPQDIQESASRVIRQAGLTVDEVVQGVLRQIAEQHSVPTAFVRLTPEQEATARAARQQKVEAAVARIKARRRRPDAPTATIEEIIAWRDEGRA